MPTGFVGGQGPDWLTQIMDPAGAAGAANAPRTTPYPIDWGSLTRAGQDSASPFYGINLQGLPDDFARRVSNFLSGRTGVKDKMYPHLLADLAKAYTAGDTIPAWQTRNSALDMRRSSAYNWGTQENQFKEGLAAQGTSLQDSGFAQKELGTQAASRDANLQQAIMGRVTQDATTNWNRRQGLMDSSLRNLQDWLSMKKTKRRGDEQLYNQMMMGQQQARAGQNAGLFQMGSSLMGAIGGMAGGS
mgnify:FL=1